MPAILSAACEGCPSDHAERFGTNDERDAWIAAHAAETGHRPTASVIFEVAPPSTFD